MLNDLRYAVRTLLTNPGFALVAVVTTALGIGANTAIFSIVNGVLLRPLPFPESDRIVSVWTATADEERSGHSAADFLDLSREQQSLEAIAGFRRELFSVAAGSGASSPFEGSYVTGAFFEVLGVRAARGRSFSTSIDRASSEKKIVLSHGACRELCDERNGGIGQILRVNGEPHTVIGVLPAQTEWPAGSRVWVLSSKEVPPSPLDIRQGDADREVRYFDAIARLKPTVTIATARQDLARVAAIVQQRHAASAARREIRIAELREDLVGDVRFGLLVLQSAVGLVLLIACANVSSLLIARATGRRRELAIRAALGAGRGRLIRQLLTESVLLGLVGGLAGLLLAAWLVSVLTTLLTDVVPRADVSGLDRVVAVVTIGVALVTGMLFGVMPAMQASGADAQSALKQGGGGRGTGSSRTLGRSVLVVAEVALTLVLLTGAGLLLNSLLRLQRVESGFRTENVTTIQLAVPQSRYPTGASQVAMYRRVLEGLSAHPEVQAVAVGFPGPLRGDNAAGSFDVEGRVTGNAADRAFAQISSVSEGYFRAMGLPLISGRTFAESDVEDAPPVAIVNETLARKYWAGQNPIGKRLRFDDDPKVPWIAVVGVVGDARQLGLQAQPPPILYMPYQQLAIPFTTIAVRSTATTSSVVSLVRTELARIDRDLPPGDVSTLQGVLDDSLAQPRFRTILLTAFAFTALLLAAVGVYGLISYSVAQRTREIGVRLALGAQPAQVLAPIMREGLVLALLGVLLGVAGGLAAGRLLGTFVFGIGTADPVTFVSVAVIMLLVACLATYIPSRRALRVDPITALRAE